MRSFLWKMNDRITRFMDGRYGFDKLYWFLFALFFLLALIRGFFKSLVVYYILTACAAAVLGYAIFRVFSRDTYKRYREAQKFEKALHRVTGFFTLQKKRFRDRKTHVYRRCASCRATLRFPKIKGTHDATCPRCGKNLTVRIR